MEAGLRNPVAHATDAERGKCFLVDQRVNSLAPDTENVHDTGRIYTPFGTDQTDFRLLTKSHRYTDSIIPNPLNTQ